jgi:hypothetical protein
LPVQVPGQTQAQAQAQAQARTPSDPTGISSVLHSRCLTFSPWCLLFSYISPRPPGPIRVSSSFPSPGRFIFQVAGHFLSFKHFRYIAFFFLLRSLYHPFFHHERHSTFLRGSHIAYTFFSRCSGITVAFIYNRPSDHYNQLVESISQFCITSLRLLLQHEVLYARRRCRHDWRCHGCPGQPNLCCSSIHQQGLGHHPC